LPCSETRNCSVALLCEGRGSSRKGPRTRAGTTAAIAGGVADASAPRLPESYDRESTAGGENKQRSQQVRPLQHDTGFYAHMTGTSMANHSVLAAHSERGHAWNSGFQAFAGSLHIGPKVVLERTCGATICPATTDIKNGGATPLKTPKPSGDRKQTT
jgi:hypothetical protein